MSNGLLTIDMITRESLRVAHEKATFIGTIDRSYDDQFAKKAYKIGDTLRVRNPNQYTRRRGSRVMDVQEQNEQSQNIVVATQDGVDMRFNSAELALSIDEFSERYIVPAMSVLVSGIDGDCLVQATKDTYNIAGTAGTVVGTSGDISGLTNARAKLNQMLAPKDQNRFLQIDSITMGSIVNGNKNIFNPSNQVSEAWREGFYSRSAMADFYENERTYSHTNIADVTGTTDAAALVTDGGNQVDMHTTVVSPSVGTIFTIAGVYDCHPETKQAYASLKNFVITATSATGAVTVSPTIYLTGPRKNVCSSTGADLATTAFNSQTLTFFGAGNTTYRQNLMYHKEAFTFVTADLPIMDDAHKCVRRTQDGLSLRVWQGSDIRNDELLMRIDILYGFKTLRPEWSCRVSN